LQVRNDQLSEKFAVRKGASGRHSVLPSINNQRAPAQLYPAGTWKLIEAGARSLLSDYS
jgi:hypothetical protein